MLKLKDVSKFYYNKGLIATGFTKINLELKMGEFVVITGESGSGKSTLLNVLSGLDSYEEGEMYINGEETSHYTEKDFEDYRRKYIANIFQSFNLVNSYTVYQNVELVMLLNGYKKSQVKQKVLDIIEKVGLTEFKNTKVSKLSGGQKQRVAIARAMIKETPIIVADEPTGNLDSASSKDVIELLKKVAKDRLVIVVTHNIEQVEEYATRIIKMHDGRIIENKEIKNVEVPEKVEESKYTKITIANKYRLGIRNTFNIIPKFLLLFAVFLFITVALLSEYASFSQTEYEANKAGYNVFFRDLSEERIIIKKKDKTAFTKEDYEKIEKLETVKYVVKDDVTLDSNISIYEEEMGIYLYGDAKEESFFDGELTAGRMPEKENEIVVRIPKDYYYVRNGAEQILNKEFRRDNDYSKYTRENAKILVVGVKLYEENDMFNYYGQNTTFYVTNEYLNKYREELNQNYSKIKSLFAGKYYESQQGNPYYRIQPSDKVASGTAIVSNEANGLFKDYKAKNKELKIEIENIYYKDELNLKVSNTYTKNSFTRITGNKDYDQNNGAIFINEEDYKSLFNKSSYQSSVFVKDEKDLEETKLKLEELGLSAKPVKDFKVNEGKEILQIIKIFKLVVTVVLILALFFISYFIIRIILKSRNVYFTTLRMLGATNKNVKRILDIELFINSSIAYFSFIIFILLNKFEILNIEFIKTLLKFLSLREYILMYIILIIMSWLISRRFSKRIFKKSAIKTYNEEV
ncbi:MAG: ATP-binding cassette domain-containing protein [Clostridia bacterium]|nr:ATP-binding cassette domain-containing protein [Clostridia bacterium]